MTELLESDSGILKYLFTKCFYFSSDRFRTATNVLGDSFGAAIVEHLSKKDLAEDPHKPLDDDVELEMQGNGQCEKSAIEDQC